MYPISGFQETLLALLSREKRATSAVLQVSINISGPLDHMVLERAFVLLCEQYELLRSSISYERKFKSFLFVSSEARVQFTYEDCSALSNDSKAQRLTQLREEDSKITFEMKTAPLWRASLIRFSHGDHRIIFSYHPVLCDRKSVMHLINELLVVYDRIRVGDESHRVVPVASSSFNNKASARVYWTNFLAHATVTRLIPVHPTRIRPDTKLVYEIIVDEVLQQKILQWCSHTRTEVNMFYLAIWAVILAKYNDDSSLLTFSVEGNFGGPDRKSPSPGLSAVVMPVQVATSDVVTFTEIISSLIQSIRNTSENLSCPFVDVAGEDTLREILCRNIIQIENEFSSASRDGETIQVRSVDFYGNEPGDLRVMIKLGSTAKIGFHYNEREYTRPSIQRCASHFVQAIKEILNGKHVLSEISILPADEKEQLVYAFNNTDRAHDKVTTVQEFFEQRVLETPHRVALVAGGKSISYSQLNARANELCQKLIQEGSQNDLPIAIFLDRSIEMVIAMMAVLKSGAPFLPLDREYPLDRVSYILSDARASMIVAQDDFEIPGIEIKIINPAAGYGCSSHNPGSNAGGANLAYIIYTSGSTGNPKGVMIEHHSVCNFFRGITEEIQPQTEDCFLATTTVSFDISILELLWTLCNGLTVVVTENKSSLLSLDRYTSNTEKMDISLFFFSSYQNTGDKKYDLFLESVKFADQNKFKAVWIPERHFHEFGGLFPNPAVVAAGVATVTDHINIRSGSVVSPLHDPIRIAEEWAVVDNLSNGRVSLSFASGWHPDDFVFKPHNYTDRKQIMLQQIQTVRKVWEGNPIDAMNGKNQSIGVRIFPEPLQKKLPVWITTTGDKKMFEEAGRIGANILTHLLGQELELLAENISLYRAQRKANGFDKGHVTLMLHTYVGQTAQEVEQTVRLPFKSYLRSSVDLIQRKSGNATVDIDSLDSESRELILENAFQRYYKSSALMGTLATCREKIHELKQIGIDEIACLVDFGVPREDVMRSLHLLNTLRSEFSGDREAASERRITMMQSTPSLMNMILDDKNSHRFIRSLSKILLGGEPLSDALLHRLRAHFEGEIFNLYGPTETTIWSTLSRIGVEDVISIGRPISNTRVYILNDRMQLVPRGVKGKIFIAGEGVCRGYMGAGRSDKRVFADSPYVAQEVLYCTGDVGRWNEDGNLECFGRVDGQVKLNGYRVELGDVEANILKSGNIKEAVVLLTESKSGGRSLTAFVVCSANVNLDDERRALQKHLPEYMIPARFIEVPTIPVTPNYKVDRKALLNSVTEIVFH